MSENRGGRPRGVRNRKPTQEEITGYLELLRGAARKGDVQAAATLVHYHAVERLHQKEPAS